MELLLLFSLALAQTQMTGSQQGPQLGNNVQPEPQPSQPAAPAPAASADVTAPVAPNPSALPAAPVSINIIPGGAPVL